MSKQLFMGNGQISQAQCFHLVEQLMSAFQLLTGMQQPPSVHEEPDKNYQDRIDDTQLDVESIAREIAESLTGKKITFGNKR